MLCTFIIFVVAVRINNRIAFHETQEKVLVWYSRDVANLGLASLGIFRIAVSIEPLQHMLWLPYLLWIAALMQQH